METYASKVVEQARAWLGLSETDGTHKAIIDLYNAHKPLARGYKVKYTDEWCATFVSAVAIKLGYTDIIPTECGCQKMVELFAKLGCWLEDESVTPKPGWIVFYHWKDNGKGDNTGRANHVGIVEKVSGGKITFIEGNYKKGVNRRTLSVNGKYLRGYAVPSYSKETAADKKETTTKEGYTLEQFIRDVQKACGAKVDGKAGPETLSKTVTISAIWNRKHAVVKAVQKRLRALGYTQVGDADGIAGKKFTSAVKAFQKDNGKKVDGVITAKQITWRKLLGME